LRKAQPEKFKRHAMTRCDAKLFRTVFLKAIYGQAATGNRKSEFRQGLQKSDKFPGAEESPGFAPGRRSDPREGGHSRRSASNF